jgi:protein-S-isoprenylcysteine O-methyltransferase Ste14
VIARWLPLVGIVLLLVIVCWRAWLQRRRHGASGVLFLRSPRWPEKVRDAFGVLLVVLLLGQAVVAAVSPTALARRDGIEPPVAAPWQVVGAGLLFGGIGLLVIALLDLGASWRIGIDEQTRPGLVTSGLYRFCRNPIFSAILVVLIGYTVLLPTGLSLAMLAGAFIGIRQQVLTEEAYLSRTYGDAYHAYASRVGRFLPGIGRLHMNRRRRAAP